MPENEVVFKRRKDNYQPNALTLSRQEYTLNERKIVAFIVNQIDHNQEYRGQNLSFKIPIVEIANYMRYEDVKKASLALMEKKVGYEDLEQKQFQYIVPFPKVSYNIKKNGLLEVTIFSDVVPFFIELGKRYTRYNLEIYLSFESIYSQKIYEILMMEHRGGKGRKKFEMNLEELQQILGSDYKDFYDFKRFVLNIAQKEIFDKADLVFEYEVAKKEGKKVTDLEFRIQSFLDIAYENVLDEMKGYQSASPNQVYAVARQLLETQYAFKKTQIQEILNTQDLLNLFVETNAKIEQGILLIKTTKTKYMATVLGFVKKKN